MTHCNHNNKHSIQGKKFRLADFFNAHWDNYVKAPSAPILPEQYKAVNAIRTCRTDALGKDMYACPDCGDMTEVYHSCKNRFCPTCSWNDTLKWANTVKKNMLDIGHRHAIFTLPHQLNPLIKKNRKLLLNILMRTSSDTLNDWIRNKYGIQCGTISVLHTFGEKKDCHYHTHMIVSWGGVNIKNGQKEQIKGEYVNFKFLKKKFRIKFENELVKAFDKGQLVHNFVNRVNFMQFVKNINQKHWIAHIEPIMENPEKVVRYIGRYSKRACLSEYKITSIEGEYISFNYKDYKTIDVKGKPIEKILKLHYSDFFPRLLQHVPDKYFRIVRYYGIYSNRSKIPDDMRYKPTESETYGETYLELKQNQDNFESQFICKYCNKRKIYQYTIVRKRLSGHIDIYKRKILEQRDKNIIEKHAA